MAEIIIPPHAHDALPTTRPTAAVNAGWAPQGFAWLDIRNAFTTPPEDLDYVLPGHLAGSVGAIIAPGAVGKSMLSIQTCSTLAGGPDTLGLCDWHPDWRPQIGRVVYLSAEDPMVVMKNRLYALGKVKTFDGRGEMMTDEHLDRLAENLFIAPLVGKMTDLMSPDWRDWILRVTQGARMVVIDTLRRFHRLDENDGGAMAGLLAFMEMVCLENGCSILFLHHTNKAGGGEQQASRGSSVLTDNVRYQANLVTMTPEEAIAANVQPELRRMYVKIGFPKVNYTAPMPSQWMQRTTGGILAPATHLMHLKEKHAGNDRTTERRPRQADKRKGGDHDGM
jgi:RecA-family ATPase